MKTSCSLLVVVPIAIASLGLFSTQALAERACDGKTTTVKIGIKGENKKPVAVKHDGKSAENLGVCIGDEIVWTVSDDDRTIIITFSGDAPFVGEKRLVGKHGKVKATINNAKSGTQYSYIVEFKNGHKMETSLTVN
ncbi:MAG: hypothetical protein ACR2QS_14305 [Woeseiaceae bacterium]